MSEIDEIVGEFLVESYENLDRYDEDLLVLEKDPSDAGVLDSLFRTIHTVKGTSGFFGFGELESLTHVAENLLGLCRDGRAQVSREVASVLLATGDAVRAILTTIESTGEEGTPDNASLKAELERLYAVATGAAEASDTVADVEVANLADATADTAEAEEAKRLGEMLVEGGHASEDEVVIAAAEQALGDGRRIGEILAEDSGIDEDVVESTARDQGRSSGRGLADTSIRVDVGLLDELMNLVGELVLARNQIVQLVTQDQESEFAGASQRLNLITTELQEGVMKTRMQPIGNVWNKLPRVVRDLSLACGKQVELEMIGQDTELDKTIIEAIKDPLTHLVRNAVDHGIEDPDVRTAAGKAEIGKLRLRAYHEGGQVNIEIADDGAGIDAERVKAKAIANGVITADQASRMPDREAWNLIFAAGFSTAEAVTNVSGRGVGMDVVRTNIERIGGTVDVHTEIGAGTTFKVKIPLTLAIVPALVVSSAGDRYAIPQLSLLELVRLEGEAARSGIELVHGAPVHRRRGQLLPIVDLSSELATGGPSLHEREVISIVVLHADGHQFGLVVDEIHDTQEIVVKPLGSHLKEASLFAGATIMGDGRVSLILDVVGIAQRARVLNEGRERAALGEQEERLAAAAAAERATLLLVEVGDDRRAAIALSDVERLEEFAASDLEWSGSQEVVQYRDDILPLLRLGDALGVGGFAQPDASLNVVVHTIEGRMVGIVVGRILDIVDQEIRFDGGSGHGPLLGSAIVQERVTDVVDVNALVAANDPSRFAAGAF
ncbi:MAG: chemotaxis protein CheA [Nitriliruptoraceae bacterium]|nr:chemotaxis protein CheA [Nitriliruptoraceae bacterium]